MDDLEEEILKNYELAFEKVISEATDPTGRHIFPEVKQLNNTLNGIGFQEEYIIRICLYENKYLAKIYIPNITKQEL